MALNVFGNPVTNLTLEGLGYKPEELTRLNRARVAFKLKNAEQKDYNARKYVENLKIQYGDGVSTECLIYNATGDILKFVKDYDWHGHIGSAPYPVEIENGQWGGFLHVHTTAAPTGSKGAAVYRGQNNDDKVCEWLACWSTPWNTLFWNNKAYTEIRDEGHYENNNYWNYISDLLEDSSDTSSDTMYDCISRVSTGMGTTVVFEALFTLNNAENLGRK